MAAKDFKLIARLNEIQRLLVKKAQSCGRPNASYIRNGVID